MRSSSVTVLAFAGVLVLAGCRRPAAEGTDAAIASAAPPASGSAVAPAPSAAAAGCSLEHGFRGTIGPKLEVLARLERTAAGVEGHYLYAHVGAELPLRGTIGSDGAVALAEGDAASPSGRFAGRCEADGHLRGTWTKTQDGAALPFDLAPVTPRDEVVVVTRKKARRFPPHPSKAPRAQQGGFAFEPKQACTEEVSWPEIFGAPTAEIEASINRALTSDAWVFPDAQGGAQLRACVVGERSTGTRSFEVLMNRAGIFAVREHETSTFEGGTHPWDPGAESWLAFDTRTGTPLTKRALLPSTKAGEEALSKLLDRCVTVFMNNGGGGGDATEMRERMSLGNLALLVLPADKGLHFGATGYAPFARVLEGEGPTIAWSALLAAGALPAGSPAARAWAGVTPAKPTDDPCVIVPPPR
ncbi:MAG: hypothetical protein JWP97_2168 [Labilithrix sp.]|nr:hypothetical protein [Labilithrix sp.]